MGYPVNRNVRDLTAFLVWLVPLAWLIYGIRDLQRPILKFGRTSLGLGIFGTTSLGRAVADQSA